MKKSLIALAVLAASGAAMAQSSVTLFGVVDTGVTYTSSTGAGNKGKQTAMTSGGNQTSRLGLRGTEDLGGGLKANFWLEGALGTDAGTAGDGGSLDFKRRSTVGLQGGFGEVRLGRELVAAYTAVSRYDVFGDVGIGASSTWKGAESGGYGNDLKRKSNMVTYVSPNFSGFRATVNYAFGESTQSTWKRGAYYGAGLTYDNGPLSLGLAAERQNNLSLPSLSGVDNRQTAYALGGSYDLGVAKVGAIYRLAKNETAAGVKTDSSSAGLFVSAPVGGVGEVKASYNHYAADRIGLSDSKADQFALGYVHNLSKRTALYGTYAYLKNKNGSTLTLGGGTTAGGEKQQGVTLGLRHAF